MNELLSEMLKNSGSRTHEDIINEMSLREMAKADAKGIDVTKTIEEVANAYVANWEKRMGKEFSSTATSQVAKSFEAPEIGAPVQDYLKTKYPSKGKTSKAFKPTEAQLNAAKKFIDEVGLTDARKILTAALKGNSLKESIRSNSGLTSLNEGVDRSKLTLLKKILGKYTEDDLGAKIHGKSYESRFNKTKKQLILLGKDTGVNKSKITEKFVDWVHDYLMDEGLIETHY